LLAHPEVIQLPVSQLQELRVRVAEIDRQLAGFSVTIPKTTDVLELDGLFVEPKLWGTGIGRALMIDAVDRARDQGAHLIEVIANLRSKGFYEKFGFIRLGTSQTQFGPASHMHYLIR